MLARVPRPPLGGSAIKRALMLLFMLGATGATAPLNYTPLPVTNPEPATRFTLPDGTLVTKIGGRVRDRHAREDFSDNYTIFTEHYFERRTHEITIYENVSPADPANRILTILVTPQWWMHNTNFRDSFLGRGNGDPLQPTQVNLYADNGGMKILPQGIVTKTPIASYDNLANDPADNYTTDPNQPPGPGAYVLVKQLTQNAALGRPLQPGDLVEFEMGFFLAGDGTVLGRNSYYSDAIVYQVGTPGAQPWYRGSCCGVTRPWNSQVLPAAALSAGLMTGQEDTSFMPSMMLSQAAPNIADTNIQLWSEGRRLFHSSFLTGEHSEPGNGILADAVGKTGPNFSQNACISCHIDNGKSSPVLGSALDNMLVLTGSLTAQHTIAPDPRFGTNLSQGTATLDNGQPVDGREAVLSIAGFTSLNGTFGDKTSYTIQAAQYLLQDKSGASLPLPAALSVRAAPSLVGLGLLEAVSETTLTALARSEENDPDGARGRVQLVVDPQDPSITRIGRFGWRASEPTVLDQIALAFNADMGVTTSIFPSHLCGTAAGATGTACKASDAGGPAVSDANLDLMARYLSLLSVPPQRHFPGEQPQDPGEALQDPAETNLQTRVQQGEQLFAQARCTACHVATLQTGDHRFAELRDEAIHPYSDLLLHDMGTGLADSYPQGIATDQEWRTAPLWGIGLAASIDPNVRYLHDGRARTLEEAILWHGNQGGPARERYKALSADQRQEIIEFLQSL
jgi:CxxC motif-containing protein (DUF1111 family)